jgi:hypothetical protein
MYAPQTCSVRVYPANQAFLQLRCLQDLHGSPDNGWTSTTTEGYVLDRPDVQMTTRMTEGADWEGKCGYINNPYTTVVFCLATGSIIAFLHLMLVVRRVIRRVIVAVVGSPTPNVSQSVPQMLLRYKLQIAASLLQ